jgi:hypothetical protein
MHLWFFDVTALAPTLLRLVQYAALSHWPGILTATLLLNYRA